jgi:ABC-2 type transport system permease protein
MPPHFGAFVLVAAVIAVLTLVAGQYTFRRLDGRFAQEL